MTYEPTVQEVMGYLRPSGWAIWNNDFATAEYFDGVEPITEAEYAKGKADYIAIKEEELVAQEAARAAAEAKLAALGLTSDDLKALGL